MSQKVIRILWVLYFLCLIPALVTLYHRHQFDRGFNSVALVADYVQLLQLAQTENVDVDDLLERVRDEGSVERLALLEDTPEFLAQRGLCTIVEGVGWPGWLTPEERDEIERNRGREPDVAEPPSTDWPLLMGLRHDMTHLIFEETEVFERIATSADMRYPGLVEWEFLEDGGGIVSLAGEPKITLEWGMGFDTELVEHLRGMGFTLYPRLRNYEGYDLPFVHSVLWDTYQMFDKGWLIFDGDSVMPIAGILRNSWIGETYLAGVGWIEFAEQRGARDLAHASPARTARVHSIEDEEMEIITVDRAVARFTRAVRERAVRIVYLKPFLLQVGDANRIDKTIELFSGVRSSLESVGFTVWEPSFMQAHIQVNPLMVLTAITALAFCVVLFLFEISVIGSLRAAFVIFFLVFIPIAAVASGPESGAKLSALGLALFSPTLAVTWLIKRFQNLSNSAIRPKLIFWYVIGSWLGAVCITLTGALLIASSMVNTWTLLAIDTFTGVKLALYLPILLAVLLGLQIIVPEDKRSLKGITEWLLSMPIRIWHVLLGIVALVGLFIMIDRSGNFPILNVAQWENDIRGWFEQMLYARPRTKEFLIGHPALIVGIYLGLSRLPWRKPLMYAGIVIGSIALTSMTNTFCHLHTPIILSIFRTIAGIVIGGIVGIALSWVILGVCGKVWKTAKGGIAD